MGIFFFSAKCGKGEMFQFLSPVEEFTLNSPTVTLVISGVFKGHCVYRDSIIWPALPSRTEGGMIFPGMHRIESLEDDSIYSCVSPLPASLTEVTPDMFKLDHLQYNAGDTPSFSTEHNHVAVIVMSGLASCGGINYSAGQKIDVINNEITLNVIDGGHFVVYRNLKENQEPV